MRNGFQGLLHAPLSVLIHAAPILHDSTFTVLKSVVWDLLLDPDPELAKTAGMEWKYIIQFKQLNEQYLSCNPSLNS